MRIAGNRTRFDMLLSKSKFLSVNWKLEYCTSFCTIYRTKERLTSYYFVFLASCSIRTTAENNDAKNSLSKLLQDIQLITAEVWLSRPPLAANSVDTEMQTLFAFVHTLAQAAAPLLDATTTAPLRVKYANEKYVIVNQNDQILIKVEREHVKERTFIRFVAFATSKGHVLNYILFVSFRWIIDFRRVKIRHSANWKWTREFSIERLFLLHVISDWISSVFFRLCMRFRLQARLLMFMSRLRREFALYKWLRLA